jgi:protein-disulfide isomerase
LPLLIPVLLSSAACSGENAGTAATGNATTLATAPAPAGRNWTETVVRTPEGGFRMGNPDAPVKLVEYGARTCPTCGAFSREAAEPLAKNYVATGKVSFEFRDFLVHGAPDLAAALLGQCGGTAVFFPILDQMYADQPATLDRLQQGGAALEQRLQSLPPRQQIAALGDAMGLVEFVKQRGVPEAQARACLNDQAAQDALTKSSGDAQASGTVTGTPTFLINGQAVPGAVSWAQIEQALKAAGA